MTEEVAVLQQLKHRPKQTSLERLCARTVCDRHWEWKPTKPTNHRVGRWCMTHRFYLSQMSLFHFSNSLNFVTLSTKLSYLSKNIWKEHCSLSTLSGKYTTLEWNEVPYSINPNSCLCFGLMDNSPQLMTGQDMTMDFFKWHDTGEWGGRKREWTACREKESCTDKSLDRR